MVEKSVNRRALILATLMAVTSIGSVALRPTAKAADHAPTIVLEAMVPKAFGDWVEEPQRVAQVVNPQTQQLLDKLYSQILTRTYVSRDGYKIMLSVAYGSDQRDELQAHKPEICYPAQGFTLIRNDAGSLATNFGSIPVRQLFTSMGARKEPVTYWFTVGDETVENKVQKRLVEIRYSLTGKIPDGLLFRVSSIDDDPARAYREHETFVNQLLQAIPPRDRQRLSGLSAS